MKSLAVIVHARMKSTRCPKKHLRPLDSQGNTLLSIALNNVRDLENVEEKYLAAHEQEIIDNFVPGVQILHRKYASVAPGNAHHSVMYKHLEEVKSDYICNYNPCQPFLDTNKLQKVIDWFNVKSGMNHQIDKINTESDFVKEILFYPSIRMSGVDKNKKDLVAISFMKEKQLHDVEYSDSYVRLKTQA